MASSSVAKCVTYAESLACVKAVNPDPVVSQLLRMGLTHQMSVASRFVAIQIHTREADLVTADSLSLH